MEKNQKPTQNQWEPRESKETILKTIDEPKKHEWTIQKIEATPKKPLKNKKYKTQRQKKMKTTEKPKNTQENQTRKHW